MGLTCEGALTELARALTLSFWPWLRASRKLHAPGIACVRLCYTTHLPTCRMPFQRALGGVQAFLSGQLLEPTPSALLSHCSTLSKCCHAMVAITYPFTWQHTYIPVLPPAMVDIVCSPTPFLIGLLTSSLPLLRELPLEEVSSWDVPVPSRGGAEERGKKEVLPKAV